MAQPPPYTPPHSHSHSHTHSLSLFHSTSIIISVCSHFFFQFITYINQKKKKTNQSKKK